jgi:hypothetical protein
MFTFKHSGDLGDIVYSLPAVKALGGGVLYLDVNGGRSDPVLSQYAFHGRTNFNIGGYHAIRPLLVEQSFIEDVRIWKGERVDYNLDLFRRRISEPKTNLALLYLREFGLDEALYHQPWLALRSTAISLAKPIVVNRTPRYQSKYHWWLINNDNIVPRAVFVGHAKEHELFEFTFQCAVEYLRTENALHIARILKGTQILIGNQSFVMSIAIGLGTPFWQEVYDPLPNCVFRRDNAQYF